MSMRKISTTLFLIMAVVITLYGITKKENVKTPFLTQTFTELNLSITQRSKLKTLDKNFIHKAGSILSDNSLTDEVKDEKLKSLYNKYNSDILIALTPVQKIKFEKINEKKNKEDFLNILQSVNLSNTQKSYISDISSEVRYTKYVNIIDAILSPEQREELKVSEKRFSMKKREEIQNLFIKENGKSIKIKQG